MKRSPRIESRKELKKLLLNEEDNGISRRVKLKRTYSPEISPIGSPESSPESSPKKQKVSPKSSPKKDTQQTTAIIGDRKQEKSFKRQLNFSGNLEPRAEYNEKDRLQYAKELEKIRNSQSSPAGYVHQAWPIPVPSYYQEERIPLDNPYRMFYQPKLATIHEESQPSQAQILNSIAKEVNKLEDKNQLLRDAMNSTIADIKKGRTPIEIGLTLVHLQAKIGRFKELRSLIERALNNLENINPEHSNEQKNYHYYFR